MKLSYIWQRFKEQLQVEKQRYSRTRYGKIVAFTFYCLAFAYVPTILNAVIPSLVQIMGEEYAYIVIALSSLTLITILWNTSMLFVYKAKLPFFEQYRINPKKPWPWQENQKEWNRLLWRSTAITAVSIFVVGGLSLFLEINIEFRIIMDVQKRSSIGWVLLQFCLMLLAQDIFFFTTHYAFHSYPFLYKIHKIHHQYTNSISTAGLHFHYIEFFFTQSISTLASMKLASIVGPFNISTLVIWFIFRLWDAFNGHCGYVFSWSPLQLLPFCTNDEFHDYHHSRNSGNYGSHFRFWDCVFDTNRQFRQYKKQQLKDVLQNKVE